MVYLFVGVGVILVVLYFLLHQRFFAWMLNAISKHPKQFKEIKKNLFSELKGKVLEIGVGTGINFEYLSENNNITHWTGIEPNKEMNPYLQKNLIDFNVKFETEIENISAESMKNIPSDSMDYVFGSHIFCSISYFQTSNVLKEISRILKKDGKFLFVEHVADSKMNCRRITQMLISPLWFLIGDGCRFAKTWEVFNDSKNLFSTLKFEHFEANMKPFGLTIIQPHIKGYFIK
jgi:ubiquinone/menaquinone biosynthesis C-methylase UbiE